MIKFGAKVMIHFCM